MDYIVFAEPIGLISGNGFIYRFLFSDTPEIVWGDRFNVTPAATVPGIQPSSEGITKEWRVVSKEKLGTAVKSTWFSMQDCIDGIISLIFSENDDTDLVINFGDHLEKVEEILNSNGIFFQEVAYLPKDDDNSDISFDGDDE